MGSNRRGSFGRNGSTHPALQDHLRLLVGGVGKARQLQGTTFRAVLNQVSQIFRVCFGFFLPLSEIVEKTLHLFLNQSEVKLKLTVTCAHAFPRA